MKKILAALLLAALLSCLLVGCATQPEDVSPTPPASGTPDSPSPNTQDTPAPPSDTASPTRPSSDAPDMPDGIRLDGSTGNVPMGIGIMTKYYGMSQTEAEETILFHKTSQAYRALVDGQSDIALVTIPDADTEQYIIDSGVEIEWFPLRREGLCFIVNEKNPVDSLTVKQLQDIYQGKITNWKDVGGEDQEIIAFQRNEDSGSQALMRDQVMKDLEMMKAPVELAPGEMGELVEQLAAYNNAGNALGYSTYYFSSTMHSRPGLKYLKIDGTPPNNGTIRSAAYPFTSESRIVIRKDEPEDGPVRKLTSWLLSSEGDKLLTDLGYVPVPRR